MLLKCLFLWLMIIESFISSPWDVEKKYTSQKNEWSEWQWRHSLTKHGSMSWHGDMSFLLPCHSIQLTATPWQLALQRGCPENQAINIYLEPSGVLQGVQLVLVKIRPVSICHESSGMKYWKYCLLLFRVVLFAEKTDCFISISTHQAVRI